MRRRTFISLIAAAFIAGCAEAPSREPSASQRADEALRDPFGYKPSPHPDVSGGGIGQYDHGAMKRDVDTVLNP